MKTIFGRVTTGLHPELPTIRRERSRQTRVALLACECAEHWSHRSDKCTAVRWACWYPRDIQTQTLTRPLHMHAHAGPWLTSYGKYLSLDFGYGVDDVASVPVADVGGGGLSFAASGVVEAEVGAAASGVEDAVVALLSTFGVELAVSVLFPPFGMDEPLGALLSSPDPVVPAAASP